jgi:Tol biopolymer transport system component
MEMKHPVTHIQIVLLCSLCIIPINSQDLYPVKRLTGDSALESFPCWSRNSGRLYYSCMDWSDPSRTGLWSMSPSGEDPCQILNDLAEHPACSPDGHYIVFDADTGNNIKIIAESGGYPIRFLPDSVPIRRGGTPCWSTDGSKIAFRSGCRVLVTDISSGRLHCVFHRPGFLPIPSCWSRDGTSVIVTIRNEATYESVISRISIHTMRITELTGNKKLMYRYSDISPDGSLLVYTSKESGDYDLWVMPVEGGTPVQLTSDPSADDGPRWSPDGTSIAFVSARSGNADIWVMTLDTAELKCRVRALNKK